MTCEPYCDGCGGNLGHPANGDWLCDKCKRKLPKVRIRRDEFEMDNPDHFRLRTRAGGFRYYRKADPMIYVGDGQYRLRSKCSPADIERAKTLNSAANVGLV